MISPSYDKAKFIKAVQDKDRPEVVRLAEQEVSEAEHAPYGVEQRDSLLGAQTAKARKWRITEYTTFLKSFLFSMQGSGIKPSGISNSDFQLFRPVFENLVQKKQFKPEVMNFFTDYISITNRKSCFY